jgi:RNA polymerase sigma factor (TIGR02999 family)
MADGSSGETTRAAGVTETSADSDRGPTAATPPHGSVDPSLDALVPIVYHELRTIAHRHLAMRGAHGATLATTALVHEAYLKLMSGAASPWRDRAHFLSVAAVAMRHILVDRARERASVKRGGAGVRITLEEEAISVDDQPEALLEIDDALGRLSVMSPRLARVVELRFYGGLSEDETASLLDVTVRTVQRDWAKARMLLRRLLAA